MADLLLMKYVYQKGRMNSFTTHTSGQGLYEVTESVESIVEDKGIDEGICVVFLQHTSASLIIQEKRGSFGKARSRKMAQ